MNETGLLGAHTSTQGGLENALLEGKTIGATTIQLFTSNQRQWNGRVITPDALLRWNATQSETGIRHVMSHASYLINLGSPKEEVLAKSRSAFREEIERCLDLDLTFLNFHPGAALKESKEECIQRIQESLLATEPLFEENPRLRLLLETTAGQGSTIGSDFSELNAIIQQVQGKIPIGVCIDTCHIFAAGYDIRTRTDWDALLAQFDREIGLQHLYAFHLNDSMYPLGCRKDRHAPLGKGEIGLDSFQVMMQHPLLAPHPKFLETPGGPVLWKEEIALLRQFARESAINPT